MKNKPKQNPKAVDAFWKRYKKILEENDIHGTTAEWYVKRVDYFIQSTNATRLKDKTAEDLRAYLAKIILRTNLDERQYLQILSALRVLFQKMLNSSWAKDFSWEEWKEPHLNFADILERYRARRYSERTSLSTTKFKDSLEGLKAADHIREELEKLRGAIRVRHYSIRTEQTYESWVLRFITFHEYKPLQALDHKDIQEYLTYIAKVRRIAANTQNQALNALVFFYRGIAGSVPVKIKFLAYSFFK